MIKIILFFLFFGFCFSQNLQEKEQDYAKERREILKQAGKKSICKTAPNLCR